MKSIKSVIHYSTVKIVLGLFFFLIFASCDTSCPSYQWFYNNKVGARICNVEFHNNEVILKATISNKSGKSILISYGLDSQNKMYPSFDKEAYSKFRDNQIVSHKGISIEPDEEKTIYFIGFAENTGKEYYQLIKKKVEGHSLFAIVTDYEEGNGMLSVSTLP
jgi:hypothetical protein